MSIDPLAAAPEGLSARAVRPRAELRSAYRSSLLIGLCCFVIYNANLRSISAGDAYPARYLPFAIVQYQTLFFDRIERVAAQGRGDGAFWILHRPDGHIISLYPVVLPVLVAPLYVPAVGYLHLAGWNDARLDSVARLMEKLTASFLASLSAALLYLLLLRRTKRSIALLLTFAYAFGTTTWVISSQASWQHGLAQLLVIGALLLLTGPCTSPRIIAAGLLLGLIAANRPPDAVLGAALGVYALFWVDRRRIALLIAAAALPLALLLLYNFSAAGNVLGGYGVIGKAQFFKHDLLVGLAGVLVSPTRGLFIFSPFLLFTLLVWRSFPRDRDERRLTIVMIVAVVLQIVLYAKVDWRSGLSWGPRYMTDLLPLLMWILVPVVASLRRVARAAFVVAVGVSMIVEAIGAFCYTGSVDLPVYANDRGYTVHDMRAAFEWRNASFIAALRQGLAPAELLVAMRGSFDAIESEGRATTAVTAGTPAFVTGWTLNRDATPAQVAVSIDGRQSIATSTFVDRADVRTTLKTSSLAGWRIPLDTTGLTPGEHRLTAFAWATGNGEGHYLEERKLTVLAPDKHAHVVSPAANAPADLAESFAKAAARIREHQQAPGYWLTVYTSETRFDDPQAEMNTFLTALLVDLLDPVAAAGGLEANVQRARKHLTDQIESDGLVRYHGRPDGPTIGTLGCAITPDTDNTALVWRIAPAPDRQRLATALATIGRYRTTEGLYRTWLAPRDAYQCLDPGRDPNPADIAIQMHLLMLLAEVRPSVARQLCAALGPLAGEDRVWVYYQKTPLVPILRLADLHRAGCDLQLPDSRQRSDVAEQQIWITVSKWIAHQTTATPDPVVIRAVLRELARDDFALIRTNPPLLFHNDLTATVARFYWSEDAGYALWLRLYDLYEHPRDRGSSH